VICVGETNAQRRRGETARTVKKQVAAALADWDLTGTLLPTFAYEPVWAIGSGRACTSHEAREVHESIRQSLVKYFGDRAKDVRIIYGGSLDARNVAEHLSTTDIDGALIGAASLDPRAFGLLCRSAAVV
jgi:triosephosphate isomerase